MNAPPTGHRASALRRRTALLDAAAELAAELGAGSVTHRAVAARAGVPLSTTSYFFASIDDLVDEALARAASARTADLEAAERVAFEGDEPLGDRLDAVAAAVLSSPRSAQAGAVEHLLARGRRASGAADPNVDATVARAALLLSTGGITRPQVVAGALLALVDGATLHRLSEGTEADGSARSDGPSRAWLAAGLRLLVAASTLTDEEIEARLEQARTDRPVGPPAPVS